MIKTEHLRGRIDHDTPNPIDVHVGERIKLRRQLLRLSQQNLAKKLGLTFQQVQKYEKGFNRVGASRLWDISRVLNVSMDFFFQDMNEEIIDLSPAALNTGEPLQSTDLDTDPMSSNEIIELARNYQRCKKFCPKIAADIFKLINDSCKYSTFFPCVDDDSDGADRDL